MTLLSSPPEQLNSLADELCKEEPRVLAVIGAGVSIGATAAPHASWLGLLKHAVQHLVDTQTITAKRGIELHASLDSAFSPFDLEKALNHAELVENELLVPDPVRFAFWLESAITTLRCSPSRTQTLDALRELHEAGVVLLTTNYDDLLSEATGLPPVTWDQHDEFLQVMNRERAGILHIHGHWSRPDSVVLGRTSYNRILDDENFQSAFRSLWLERLWMYVGCGDGLDDPNLGRLLKWGNRWNRARKHYFLAKSDIAQRLTDRPERPRDLVSYGYADHVELPSVLLSLIPTTRPGPFAVVDDEFALFRSPSSSQNVPFPTRNEYLAGAVPQLVADSDVQDRLEEHGWAFLLAGASVGKTTLALRFATAVNQRDHRTFYLDLARVDPADGGVDVLAAARRLTREHVLLILDNCHHQPEIARQIWEQWRERPRGSRLLLIATRTQRAVITSAVQDLAFFEHHAKNPAVELRPQPEDLWRIVEYQYDRVASAPRRKFLPPPSHVLNRWYADYGATLGAFCVATLDGLARFARGDWDLPPEAASAWVWQAWLRDLSPETLTNVLCLAVFGSQELELTIYTEALPHPKAAGELPSTLVIRTEHGYLKQYKRFGLREPGWGKLILAAVHDVVEERHILFNAAARDPMTAIALLGRLRQSEENKLRSELWDFLDGQEEFPRRVAGLYFPIFQSLIKAALADRREKLAERCWHEIEADGSQLSVRLSSASLHVSGAFIEAARRQGRDVEMYWRAWANTPDSLRDQTLNASLDHLATFIETAKNHERNVDPLWQMVEAGDTDLIRRIWEATPGQMSTFLDIADRHGRDVVPVWEALTTNPERVAAKLWDAPLAEIKALAQTAKRHDQDLSPVWNALRRDPERVVARCFDAPLGQIGGFLKEALPYWDDVSWVWYGFERDPERLAERVWATSWTELVSFVDSAKAQGWNPVLVWTILASDGDRFVSRACDQSLGQVASLLEAADRHQRDMEWFWESLVRDPDTLSRAGQQASLPALASFSRAAPSYVLRATVRDFNAESWRDIPVTKPMAGAASLAAACAEIDRPDLSSSLIQTLLTRASPKDFPPQSRAFRNVGWLLANIPEDASELVQPFLTSLCTPKWLLSQYKIASCGVLAAGLRWIALRQPIEIRRLFEDVGLRIRLGQELARFPGVNPQEQSLIIQLLGSASMFGLKIPRGWVEHLPLSALASLPVKVLPHAQDAEKVEDWHLQLWVGLRAVAGITGQGLKVLPDAVRQTLELWQFNLRESTPNPASAEHALNTDMVGWLSACSRAGVLLPNRARQRSDSDRSGLGQGRRR